MRRVHVLHRSCAALLLAAGAALGLGCQGGLEDAAPLPALDKAYFDCNVQPILTKSCAQLTCHGDTARYMKVYARNRLRLGMPESKRNAFLAPEELQFNYDAARAFVVPGKPDDSWLLMKPLSLAAGGIYHAGEDRYKRGNVFAKKDDKDYATIAQWIQGAKEDPACEANVNQ